MSKDVEALRARLEWLCGHLPQRVQDGWYHDAAAWKDDCQKGRGLLRRGGTRDSLSRAISRLERWW